MELDIERITQLVIAKIVGKLTNTDINDYIEYVSPTVQKQVRQSQKTGSRQQPPCYWTCPLATFLFENNDHNMTKLAKLCGLNRCTIRKVRSGIPVNNKTLGIISENTGLTKEQLLYSHFQVNNNE